ncbi:putative transcription factor MYB-HB-like family [Helianthus annuus]|uniref:transcription factor MAMYB n=1 Tax=Helianthus annuus TaxID=4232 RepID=UPI000B8FFF69|nr:transcription factor MAMYB [Helianthus annuus]KAJ0572281.1 putative transcription factor MYB-HB-like family [Helianthus annuus]KAJ0910385.1 putative transcription factor MYB-HB-like family [Helianthus annuus]
MEFFDEESRPRFLLQSRSPPKPNPQTESLDNLHKPTLFISLSLSALLLTLSLFYIKSDPFQSIFIWFSLSLLIGPFAPPSLTAGDIRVGLGPTLQPQTPVSQTLEPDPVKRSRIKHRKPDQEYIQIPSVVVENTQKAISEVVVVEEKDWTFEDLELLKKQMVKNPVGMPGRWEAVAEVFKGRHKVESVVKMAKSMGDKKVNDSDSFSKFLKDRKAVDKRVDEVIESERGDGSNVSNNVSNGGSWSSAEDIALLNALKAFPKDVAMRWEKITAAVPGRSKAACMKRVADLKKDFRSSKAASQA